MQICSRFLDMNVALYDAARMSQLLIAESDDCMTAYVTSRESSMSHGSDREIDCVKQAFSVEN